MLTELKNSAAGTATEAEQFRLLVQSVTDYAIFLLDAEGYVSTWNPGAERIKGYRRDEIVGQHFSRFYTEEDRAAGEPGVEHRASQLLLRQVERARVALAGRDFDVEGHGVATLPGSGDAGLA